MAYPKLPQIEYSPAYIGMSGVTIASAKTSSSFGTNEYNQLTLDLKFTFAACTAITWFLEHSPDGEVTWYRLQTGSILAGVDTQSDHQWSKATGSASGAWSFNIPINYKTMRIKSMTGTAATTDVVSVTARLLQF